MRLCGPAATVFVASLVSLDTRSVYIWLAVPVAAVVVVGNFASLMLWEKKDLGWGGTALGGSLLLQLREKRVAAAAL